MSDGQGKLVCVTNPGCNCAQTPRVGYDLPGQGKATMEFMVRMYAPAAARARRRRFARARFGHVPALLVTCVHPTCMCMCTPAQALCVARTGHTHILGV